MQMKTLLVSLFCLSSALSFQALGQQAAASPDNRKEPVVKHTVIEDDGARIEELRVRGENQRISVTPKRGTNRSYEIIPAGGARDMSDSASSTRGAAGKRVWNVLSF